jgi:predicted transcriptional regulator of viral defense system
MSFIEFRSQLFNLVCFNTNQVYAFDPSFDKNNLTNWVKKGYILKLRQGYYTFPEYFGESGFSLYLANKIYRPSYISLHSALSFYGLIPESVLTITSVSTLKTAEFENNFGRFSYNSVKESAYFGFVIKTL